MPVSHPVTVIAPAQVWGTGEVGPFPFDLYHGKCLAQGDSWFSIGAIPPGLTTNVLAELELGSSVAVVNCARPGAVLHHMTDTCSDRQFTTLLKGRRALQWNAILLSGGGNDVIDAASVGPAAPPDRRLLSRADERGRVRCSATTTSASRAGTPWPITSASSSTGSLRCATAGSTGTCRC